MSISLAEKFTKTRVGFAGDWHGNTFWALKMIDLLKQENIEIIYHLGDFGLWGGHDGAKYLLKLEKKLRENNMLLVVTPGNHENYDALEKIPENPLGFLERHDLPHIWFTPRGKHWEQRDLVFASLGGAGSIDKDLRVKGVTWWAQEEITELDIDKLVKENEKYGKLDVLLTHEVPAGVPMGEKNHNIPPEIVHYCYKQRMLLREAVDIVKPKLLMHGHWHRYNEYLIEGLDTSYITYETKVIGLSYDGTKNNVAVCSIVDNEIKFEKFI
jgi:Icc-related predicted phosphoesterase